MEIPAPIHGSVGVYAMPFPSIAAGLDGEIGFSGLPVTLSVATMAALGGGPQGSAWLRSIAIDDRKPWSVGVIAGAGWSWSAIACPTGGGAVCPTGPVTGPPGIVAGLAVQWRWESQWLRFQPNTMVVPFYGAINLHHMVALTSGPAWLEYGLLLTPSVELTIRASYAPVRLAWRF